MLRSTLALVLAIALGPQALAHAQGTPGNWRGTPVGPPPPPRMEHYKPRRGFVWIDGNYEWRDGRYMWVGGRWERERPGKRWHGGRWDRQGDRFVWIQGEWIDGSAYPQSPTVVVEQPPPMPAPPPQAAQPPPPGPGFVWIQGANEWRDGRYVWIEGHWERERQGERWEGGHWDHDHGRHAWHEGGWRHGDNDGDDRRDRDRRGYPAPPPVSITGQVVAHDGRPLPGVTIVLAGSSEGRFVTGPDGRYAFTGLVPGSYAVRPNDPRCSFAPDVMNLNNLGGPAVQNFNARCGGWR